MAETVCKFVGITRITNINCHLFKDKKLSNPRLPSDLEKFIEKYKKFTGCNDVKIVRSIIE